MDGYLFEVSDGARTAFFSAGAGTPYALNRAHAAAVARDKAFAQIVLAEAGLATIPSRLFFVTETHRDQRRPGREPSDARAFAQTADYPMFCKPISGSQGAFAEIIADAGQFERYLARVAAKHYAILAQPVIDAREHRVFVLNGAVLFAYEKTRPMVLGNGYSNLTELTGGAETVRARGSAGGAYRALDVPAADEVLVLDGPANRATGGGAGEIVAAPAAAFGALALRAAAALDLDVAAVDLFEGADGPIVIEVNSSPAIKTLEAQGRWDLIEAIWTANIRAALR